MIVILEAEDRMIVSWFVWTQHRNVTDRQTDRRTDLLWLLQLSAWRAINADAL